MTPTDSRRPPAAGSLQCPNCGAVADEQATQCPYCLARLATVSCPSCFRRLFAGASFCSHCGAAAARQADAEAARVPCPQCKRTMAAAQVGSLTLSECEKCHGLWVAASCFERLCADKEAQAAVLHTKGPAASPSAPARGPAMAFRYRPCPTCKTMMNRVNFAAGSGVVLDVCRKHGTFFDRDELHRIVTFIQGGGLERARTRAIEALKEEQRRLQALQNMPQGRTLPDYGAGGGYVSPKWDASAGLFEAFVSVLFDR